MPATITIVTPENVEVTYELAGIGTRCLAALMDILIHGLVLLLVIYGLIALNVAEVLPWDDLSPWILAAVILLLFGLFWGYYIFFETRWSGQTPGKRKMRLRVIKDGGYPIDFRAALIRNLMRYVDGPPAFYAVGVTSIFFSREYKRLGDFVAGTIVVQERPVAAPGRLLLPTPPVGGTEPPPFNVSQLTRKQYLAVRHFLDRRDSLPEATRARLAAQLAAPLQARLEWYRPERPTDPQQFLEAVARGYEGAHSV